MSKGESLVLELGGVSAHGMEPKNGKNAGLYLAKFLAKFKMEPKSKSFFSICGSLFWR